jgi:CMP-N-acetylneuraminic acid synthetase
MLDRNKKEMIIFIPIKQNSQRVPRKNFRQFSGSPLYKHVIRKFYNHKVFVDTDSDEILEECKKDTTMSHVTAYKRKEHLTGHKISVCDLILNFIHQFEIKDPIAQIHVTSPFLTPDLLEKAYKKINKYDSVVSCNIINSRLWREEKYGYCPVNHNPLKMEQTQDLPKYYEENSAFYIFEPNVIKSFGNRIGQNPFFYEINEPYNIDVDTEEDWNKAMRQIK